jgi:pimeloyl-ACP methyl ester carboxylesterase
VRALRGQLGLDDVIAHSTGGLVARTYIQSAAYGGEYAAGKNLPRVNNLIMVGVPNRGASKAWNPLHDNWVVDPAFQLVLSKIVNRAHQKVLQGGVITGPDYDITLASLQSPQCQDSPHVCFINQDPDSGDGTVPLESSIGQFYVWKTSAAWANTCRQLVIRLNDGQDYRANFRFK